MGRSAYTRAALSDVGRALPVIAIGTLAALAATRTRKAGVIVQVQWLRWLPATPSRPRDT
jgi:hypothetical protein